MRRYRIGQPLGAIHEKRIDGAGESRLEPALVHQAEGQGRDEEREPTELANGDALEASRDQHACEVAAKRELLGQGNKHDRAQSAQAKPKHGKSRRKARKPDAELALLALSGIGRNPDSPDKQAGGDLESNMDSVQVKKKSEGGIAANLERLRKLKGDG